MKILVVLTGGTIGSKTEGKMIDVNEAAAYNLIHLYEEKYGKNVEFNVVQPLNILSENLQPKHWEKLINCMDDVSLEDYDGVIVTHGTDTLSYTAAMLGYYYRHTSIPIILIASNYELTHPLSNGLDNFRSAICFIKEKAASGVFVIFRNDNMENRVYLATRLLEAENYRDQFSCYGKADFGVIEKEHFIRSDHEINPSVEELNLPKEKLVKKAVTFDNEVMLIQPYPGLDYSRILLDKRIKAVLHWPYHSATLCSVGDAASAVLFIKECKEKGIAVYLCGFKQDNDNIYVSSNDMLQAGAIPLKRISREAAYAKLVLAYNQTDVNPEEFMQKDIYFEILPQLS